MPRSVAVKSERRAGRPSRSSVKMEPDLNLGLVLGLKEHDDKAPGIDSTITRRSRRNETSGVHSKVKNLASVSEVIDVDASESLQGQRKDVDVRHPKPEPSRDPKIRAESPETVSLDKAEIRKQMKTWENPKVKKKKEGVTIPEDIIISRFTAAGIPYVKFNVEMDQALRDEAVSRAFMSKVYGGSSQRTFPKPRPEKIDEHGLNDFMFLPEDYQPSAPFTPGAPGLWLNVQNDGEGPNVYDGQIKRLFSRIDKQSSPRLWLYQGQYELKVVKSLTIREWQAMDKPVRNTWAKEICDNNWGNPTQISIYARKEYGRAPTEDEKTDILARKLHDKITPADINAAFLCGEETLAVYTMKCVAHDGDFQRQVAERYTEWKANPPKATKRKRGSDENPKPEPKSESEEPMMTAARQNDGPAAKRQKSGVGAKRVRRSISPEEEHDSLWRPYTSKGTRSRPAKSWPGANS